MIKTTCLKPDTAFVGYMENFINPLKLGVINKVYESVYGSPLSLDKIKSGGLYKTINKLFNNEAVSLKFWSESAYDISKQIMEEDKKKDLSEYDKKEFDGIINSILEEARENLHEHIGKFRDAQISISDSEFEAKSKLKEETLVGNGYNYDKAYGDMCRELDIFDGMRSSGLFNQNDINKMVSMFVDNFKTFILDLANPNTELEKLGAIPTGLLKVFKQLQNSANSNVKDFFAAFNQQSEVSFYDLIKLMVDQAKLNYLNNVYFENNLYKCGGEQDENEVGKKWMMLTILDKYITPISILAKPEIKQKLKVVIPIVQKKSKISNDVPDIMKKVNPENSTEEPYVLDNSDITTTEEDYDGTDGGVNPRLEDGDDAVVSRTDHYDRILTTELSRNLSRELQLFFSSIENKLVRFDEYGGKNYYNEKSIYRAIRNACFMASNSEEMMEVLQSDDFSQPWTSEVVELLENTENLPTKLFTAIHTAENTYLRITIEKDGASATFANTFTQNDLVWQTLRDARSDDNKLLKYNERATREEDMVVINTDVAKAYMAALKAIMKLIPYNKKGVNGYRIETLKDNKGRKVNVLYKGNIPMKLNGLVTFASHNKISEMLGNDGVKEYANEITKAFSNPIVKSYFDKPITAFLDKVLSDLGFDNVRANRVGSLALELLTNPRTIKGEENKKRTILCDNFKYLIEDKLLNIINSKNGLLSTTKEGNIGTMRTLIHKINPSYLQQLDETCLADGKSYQKNTYCNHLQHELMKIRNMSDKEIKEWRATIKQDAFSGTFFDREWFHSWLKDKTSNSGGHSLDLATFLSYNNTSWNDLSQEQYLLSQFSAFFRSFVDHKGYHSKEEAWYSLPQMEDKSTAYFIRAAQYNTKENQEGISELSSREACVFIQELARIKEIGDKVRNGEVFKDGCQMMTQVENGNVIKLPFIDFEHSLGRCMFRFIGKANRLLALVNNDKKFNEDNDPDLSQTELKLIQLMRAYIYADADGVNQSEDEGVDLITIYTEDGNGNTVEERDTSRLEVEIVNTAAKWLQENAMRDFQKRFDNLSDNNRFRYMQSLVDNGAATIVMKKYIDSYYKEKDDDKKEAIKWELLANNACLEYLQTQMFHQYYNQKYATEQIYEFFTGDISQYENNDTMTKRMSQFISSGIFPDASAVDADSKRKKIMVLRDVTGNFLGNDLYKALYNAFYEAELNGRSKESLSESEHESIDNYVRSVLDDYINLNSTDGQSIMSVHYLKNYLKSIGRLDGYEDFLDIVEEIYETDDPDRLTELVDKYLEITKSKDFHELNTLKTHTFYANKDGVDIFDPEKKFLQAEQIKTAEMLPLDVMSFITRDKDGKCHKDENNLIYRLQKVMTKKDSNGNYYVDGMAFESALKVWQPDYIYDVNTTFSSINDIISNMENALDRQDGIFEVPIEHNILAVETPSEFFGTERALGIQFQHLVMQLMNAPEGTKLNVAGEMIGVDDLYDRVNDMWGKKYKILYDEIFAPITKYDNVKKDENGLELTPHYKKWLKAKALSDMLTQELIKSDSFSYAAWRSLQIDRDGNFNVPLTSPTLYMLVQKLIINKVKKTLIAAPMKGGHLIQTAEIRDLFRRAKEEGENAFFLDAELEFETEKDDEGNVINCISMEADIPIYNPVLLKKYTNEKGEIDSETLKKEHPELCELICYRIPTEGYCSMFRIKVRKFTNPKSGGNITLPKAITTITGADFDIDKMFFLAPAIDSEGNFIKPGTESKEAIDNWLLSAYKSILGAKQTFADRFYPQGFKDIEEMYKEMRDIDRYANKEITEDELFNGVPYGQLDMRDIGSPEVQALLHVQNSISKSSVGIFANPNTVHSILMHHPPVITFGANEKIIIDGNSLIDNKGKMFFSTDKCANGKNMGRQLRQLLAAAVDDAKKPKFAFLNISTYTADMISTLVQMGFDVKQAILIMNQPAAIDFVNKCADSLDQRDSNYIDLPSFIISAVERNTEDDFSTINFNRTSDELKSMCAAWKSATSKEEQDELLMQSQNELIPLLYRLAKITQESKLMQKKMKVDNAGATTWNSIYDYVKYRLERWSFEEKVKNGESVFDTDALDIFNSGSGIYDSKLGEIEKLSDDAMQNLFTEFGTEMTPDVIFDMCRDIMISVGKESLSVKEIRNIVSSMMAYKYVNNNEYGEIDYKYYIGTNEEQSKFSKDIQKARAFFRKRKIYDSLFGYDGLFEKPTSVWKDKTTFSGFHVVGTYLMSKDHNFRNAMQSDWEQMFYDDTVIKETDMTVKELAHRLVDYFVIKNGFNVTYGNAAMIIPYMAINQMDNLRQCTKLSTFVDEMDKIERNKFIELYVRNNRQIAYKTKYKMGDDRPSEIPVEDFKEFENSRTAPQYIRYGGVFYEKIGATYYRGTWLGADEIMTEYDKNIGRDETYMGEGGNRNRLWAFKSKDDKKADFYDSPEGKRLMSDIQDAVNKLGNVLKTNAPMNNIVKMFTDIGISKESAAGFIDRINNGKKGETVSVTMSKGEKNARNFIDAINKMAQKYCKKM